MTIMALYFFILKKVIPPPNGEHFPREADFLEFVARSSRKLRRSLGRASITHCLRHRFDARHRAAFAACIVDAAIDHSLRPIDDLGFLRFRHEGDAAIAKGLSGLSARDAFQGSRTPSDRLSAPLDRAADPCGIAAGGPRSG